MLETDRISLSTNLSVWADDPSSPQRSLLQLYGGNSTSGVRFSIGIPSIRRRFGLDDPLERARRFQMGLEVRPKEFGDHVTGLNV